MNIIITQDVTNQDDFNDWLDLVQLWTDCAIADLTKIIQSSPQAGFLVRTENRLRDRTDESFTSG